MFHRPVYRWLDDWIDYPSVNATVTMLVVGLPLFLVFEGDLNTGLMLLTYVLGAIAFGWYGGFFGPVILVAFTNFAREILPALLEEGARLLG